MSCVTESITFHIFDAAGANKIQMYTTPIDLCTNSHGSHGRPLLSSDLKVAEALQTTRFWSSPGVAMGDRTYSLRICYTAPAAPKSPARQGPYTSAV